MRREARQGEVCAPIEERPELARLPRRAGHATVNLIGDDARDGERWRASGEPSQGRDVPGDRNRVGHVDDRRAGLCGANGDHARALG